MISVPDRSAHSTCTSVQERVQGVDARRHRRARAHWAARLIGAGHAIHDGHVCDVSEGGIGVMSGANLPVGTIVDVAVAIPHPRDARRSQAVTAKMRVVFSAFVGTKSRLGLQFLALPVEARIAIRAYVLAHS